MNGIDQKQAKLALELGWDREELLRLHNFLLSRKLSVTHIGVLYMLVEQRWLAYRHSDLVDLALALSTTYEETICYTDGSGTNSTSLAGIGCVVYEPHRAPRFIAEHIGAGTNNVAELRACWRALKAIPDVYRTIRVYTDSEYAIGSCSNPNWTATKNVELIQNIRQDLDFRFVSANNGLIKFIHVDGHSGDEGNEIADRLANIGRKLVKKVSL